MHATAFLKAPDKQPTGPVVALFGKQRYLKHAALAALSQVVLGGEEDDDISRTQFAGKDLELKTVLDELSTVSMWGDKRLVVIDEADEFVTANRPALENYVQNPAKKSVLVLDVKTWSKTTRLAKAVAKMGLAIDCSELSGGELVRWLSESAQTQHGKTLRRDAAALMVELAGNELGLLEQELAKLAAYVGDKDLIDAESVSSLVGGWKAETTWAMVDALRGGNLGLAIKHLDKLLTGGEAPQRILGGLNFVFRKLAQATEAARQGINLNLALKQTGVFPRDINGSAQYLRRIGRPRAERLFNRLLQADSDMKGGSRLNERMQLERLLVDLSGKA